jgi:hypothetical protein
MTYNECRAGISNSIESKVKQTRMWMGCFARYGIKTSSLTQLYDEYKVRYDFCR